jgi:nitrate reductase alpha subunit
VKPKQNHTQEKNPKIKRCFGNGKLDLVVNINSRMDTTALYSDLVLPTATFYEKNDLNNTDMQSYIHPLTQKSPRQPAPAVLKLKKAAFYQAL